MKNTLVVNLYGGQGTGKSTTMAGVFHYLKLRGVDCEMTPEFAKELVWEGRSGTFQDELYLFAKQNHRLQRVNGKVDVVITDHPLLLSAVYNEHYHPVDDVDWNQSFDDIVWFTYNLYNNMNFMLKRVKPYNPNGRNETEDEAKEFDGRFEAYLNAFDLPYTAIDADKDAAETIGEIVLGRLK